MQFERAAYSMLIREHHLDTFGHVNNATYLSLLEEARWQFITEKGFGLETVRKTGLGPVILDISIQFKRELRNRTAVIIYTQVQSYDGKIAKMHQSIVTEAGETSCEAKLVFGLFDLNRRKLVDPPPEWIKALGKMEPA